MNTIKKLINKYSSREENSATMHINQTFIDKLSKNMSFHMTSIELLFWRVSIIVFWIIIIFILIK